MDAFKGFVYRLAPTPAQRRMLAQSAGVCRVVYNLALEQRSKWGVSHGCNYFSNHADLKILRKEFPWIGAVSQNAQVQALRDLDKAFVRFFKGVSGPPTMRRKGVRESFTVEGVMAPIRVLNSKYGLVRIPRVGWVKFRLHRPVIGKVCTATMVRSSNGNWSLALSCKTQAQTQTRASLGKGVGVDLGVCNPVALSTGTHLATPGALCALDAKIKKAQRVVSRRVRGSNRRKAAARRVANLCARRARVRNHWQHVVSYRIAKRFDVVALENLNVKGMTRSARGALGSPGRNVSAKAGLNRAILNIGWAGLIRKIKYKVEYSGGKALLVNPAFTSQTCAVCGAIDKLSRKNQASFVCTSCGHSDNADVNAAKNILQRGRTALLGGEGEVFQPYDPSTRSACRPRQTGSSPGIQ